MKLEWRPVTIEDGPPISTSLTKKETVKLRSLAKGKNVLEVGSAFGYSAIVEAQVAIHVDAVDPHIQLDSLNTITHNLRAYDVEDRVTLHLNSSQQVLPGMPDESYDLVFVDGDHHEQSVTFDVAAAIRLVAPGGVVAVHDYDEDTCPGVRPVVDRLLQGGELVDTLWVWTKPSEETA